MKNLLIFLTILLLSLFIGSCSIDDVQDNIDLEIEEYAPLSATDDIVALMENFKTNILNNRNTIEAYKNN
jgi:thioredoxin-related protein